MKRQVPEPAALLKWLHTIWVCMLHILIQAVHRSERRKAFADTARVLGRMFDGIEYRGYGQEIVEELAKYAGVPVWNGLTNEYPSDTDARRYADNS